MALCGFPPCWGGVVGHQPMKAGGGAGEALSLESPKHNRGQTLQEPFQGARSSLIPENEVYIPLGL